MAKDRRAMVNPFAGITTKAPVAAEAPTAASTAEAQVVEVAERSSPPTAPRSEPRERVQRAVDAREYLGFRLPTSLADRARAVAWTQRQSLTAYVEAALEAAVAVAEQTNGGRFRPWHAVHAPASSSRMPQPHVVAVAGPGSTSHPHGCDKGIVL